MFIQHVEISISTQSYRSRFAPFEAQRSTPSGEKSDEWYGILNLIHFFSHRKSLLRNKVRQVTKLNKHTKFECCCILLTTGISFPTRNGKENGQSWNIIILQVVVHYIVLNIYRIKPLKRRGLYSIKKSRWLYIVR